MATKKPSCLMVCSGVGVSAQSFIHAFTLTHQAFNVHLVTPGAQPVHFEKVDENSKRWLNEFKSKPFSVPGKLEDVDVARYSALLVPSGIGPLTDLPTNDHLSLIISACLQDKKPICAIGGGVAALCSVKDKNTNTWAFKDYCLTAPSLSEMAQLQNFGELPLVLEDFIKENEATYSASKNDSVHVVIDRHVITGQNDMSTLPAVQNVILLSNARQGKSK